MSKKEKSCLNCRAIYSGSRCPKCGEVSSTNKIKGKIYIFNFEKSELAHRMKLNSNGEFAIKNK